MHHVKENSKDYVRCTHFPPDLICVNALPCETQMQVGPVSVGGTRAAAWARWVTKSDSLARVESTVGSMTDDSRRRRTSTTTTLNSDVAARSRRHLAAT